MQITKTEPIKSGCIWAYSLGLSFSHNFTQKNQLDIQTGGIIGFPVRHNSSYIYIGGDFYAGYLRSIAEININGAVCPFEIGGGISFTSVVEQTYPNQAQKFTLYIGVFFDIR